MSDKEPKRKILITAQGIAKKLKINEDGLKRM